MMDELDLLKSDWNKQDNFPKIDRSEIRMMLHRKSSSIVKWICIISCIEFGLGIIFNLLFDYYTEDKDDSMLDNSSYIAYYIILGVFIYFFFRQYRKIKNYKDTKTLTADILRSRKLVKTYVYLNLGLILIEAARGFVAGFTKSTAATQWQHIPRWFEITMIAILLIIVLSLFFGFVWAFYYFVYLRLTKKLKKNYDELVKLEEE